MYLLLMSLEWCTFSSLIQKLSQTCRCASFQWIFCSITRNCMRLKSSSLSPDCLKCWMIEINGFFLIAITHMAIEKFVEGYFDTSTYRRPQTEHFRMKITFILLQVTLQNTLVIFGCLTVGRVAFQDCIRFLHWEKLFSVLKMVR